MANDDLQDLLPETLRERVIALPKISFRGAILSIALLAGGAGFGLGLRLADWSPAPKIAMALIALAIVNGYFLSKREDRIISGIRDEEGFNSGVKPSRAAKTEPDA